MARRYNKWGQRSPRRDNGVLSQAVVARRLAAPGSGDFEYNVLVRLGVDKEMIPFADHGRRRIEG